jgi:hypothetical protein
MIDPAMIVYGLVIICLFFLACVPPIVWLLKKADEVDAEEMSIPYEAPKRQGYGRLVTAALAGLLFLGMIALSFHKY